MPVPHNRLDLKLITNEFSGAECGSANLRTREAEYCGYACPTLKARMEKGEDPSVPTNSDSEASTLEYQTYNPA